MVGIVRRTLDFIEWLSLLEQCARLHGTVSSHSNPSLEYDSQGDRLRLLRDSGARKVSQVGCTSTVRAAGSCARSRAEIGLQNLAYNIRRLVTLERMAAA